MCRPPDKREIFGMNHPPIILRLLGVLLLFTRPVFAGSAAGTLAHKPLAWFRTPEARSAVDNVLSWQSPRGAWPKNQDTTAQPFRGDPRTLAGTFDNGATTGELRLLARAYHAAPDARSQGAFLKGFDHVLQAQYPNGGWPQFYPPGSNYHRHITFNDDAMARLLEFLREVVAQEDFSWIDAPRRAAAEAAFQRGIDCIVKCQVTIDGHLTVWCAQHDPVTLEPRPARSYELVSLSGAESAGLLRLLMSLDRPTPEVVRAVEAGVAWYDRVKLTGIRQIVRDGDKRIVSDPEAPPLWARFYEIPSLRPMFSGRDGIKKYDLSDIEAERRNGYAWYGPWGTQVATEYARWKQREQR